MTAATQDTGLSDSEPQTDEAHTKDVSARILANRIKRESKLRDIIEQSSCRFYFGSTMLVISLRLIALIAFGYVYFRAGLFSTVSFWPIVAFGGFIEALRANRRLDAMLELDNIKTSEDESCNS